MYHQTIFSSLILAALASATPTLNPLRTPSVTHERRAAPTSFKIQYQLAYDYGTNAPAVNGFADLITSSDDDYYHGSQVQGYTDDASDAATFTLNADGSLSVGDLYADLPAVADDPTNVFFQTEDAITSGGYSKTYCTLDGADLECSTNVTNYGTADVYYTCGSAAPFSIDVDGTGRPYQDYCYTLKLVAVSL